MTDTDTKPPTIRIRASVLEVGEVPTTDAILEVEGESGTLVVEVRSYPLLGPHLIIRRVAKWGSGRLDLHPVSSNHAYPVNAQRS